MSDMMMKMIAFFAANTFLNEKQPPLVWFLPACWLCDCVAFSTAPASLYIRFLRAHVCECAFASVWAQHTCVRTHDDDAARNDARDREVSQLWARASHLFANVADKHDARISCRGRHKQSGNFSLKHNFFEFR